MSNTLNRHPIKNTAITRYTYLDGWRGLAIIFVLFGHFQQLPGISAGSFGVELFFVLSGRLMAEILFVKNIDLTLFLKRRISRVWPALFVFITIIAIIAHTYAPASWDNSVRFTTVISAYTFTYNYYQLFAGGSQVFDHMWSLCVEEHIYLILAGIAYLSRRYKWNPIKVLAVIALVFVVNGVFQTFYLKLNYWHVYLRTDVRGASILIAAITYLYLQKNGAYKHLLHNKWVPILFFLIGLILNYRLVPNPIKYSLGTLCLAISICSIANLPTFLMRLITHPALVWIGLVSFSIYIWQQPFHILSTTMQHPLVLLPFVFAIAILSYYLIEVPSRRFLNTHWAK